MTTTILRTTTRTVVPIVVVVSLALFVQGHNQPGGGFIGAVLAAAGIALVYIAYGSEFLEDVLLDRPSEGEDPVTGGVVADYYRVLAAGLLVAVVSGLVPVFVVGDPFLSQYFTYLHDVPLYGELEVASAVAFDLGVFLAVVGALLVVLSVVGAE